MLITRSGPTDEANSLACLNRLSQLDNDPRNTSYFTFMHSSTMRQSTPASLDSIPVGGLRIAGAPESLHVWLENWEMVAISEYMPRQPDVQE